jgi:hypothetical protein
MELQSGLGMERFQAAAEKTITEFVCSAVAYYNQYQDVIDEGDALDFAQSLWSGSNKTYRVFTLGGEFVISRLVPSDGDESSDEEPIPFLGQSFAYPVKPVDTSRLIGNVTYEDFLTDAIAEVRVGVLLQLVRSILQECDSSQSEWQVVEQLVKNVHPVYRLVISLDDPGFPSVVKRHKVTSS